MQCQKMSYVLCVTASSPALGASLGACFGAQLCPGALAYGLTARFFAGLCFHGVYIWTIEVAAVRERANT